MNSIKNQEKRSNNKQITKSKQTKSNSPQKNE